MKKQFIINKEKLLPLLASMQPLCTKRTTLDATAMILFQIGHRELVLKSTDLEVSLQSSCMLEESTFADVESFLVSGKRLYDIVRELDGAIVFILKNNQLHIEAQGIKLALNCKDAQDFPPFPERIENLMTLDTPLLLKMFERVSFLIPQNNSNPALNGLYMEVGPSGLSMTSTDGHCLAQAKTDQCALEASQSWLLPRRSVFELKKIIENSHDAHVFLGTCNNQLVFSGELFNFFTKLIANPFPEYRPILRRDGFVPAKIDRSHFIKTLRRTTCLLSGQFLAALLTFDAQKLRVALQNKEVGFLDEELMLDYNADELSIRFYTPYLLSGLQVLPDENVTCYIKNGTKPIIFESEHDGVATSYLVMPVSQSAAESHST